MFVALSDTQRRFGDTDELLEELVRGTTMDLEPGSDVPGGSVALGDGLQGYATFEDLYRYCYLVASVVGLVCIRIFGYSDPAAEQLAEETGDRVSADEYSARCEGGCGAGADLSAAGAAG